jgi:hypothetical protein
MMTKALSITADLDVADALSTGPTSVGELAQQTGAHPDTLHRILRALASGGVFAEVEPGVFRNTEASELLRNDRPASWGEFAHLFGGLFFDAVAGLDPRTNEPTFGRTHGSDFWPWLAAHPDERVIFDRAMAGGKSRSAERLAELEWNGDETVVDVGGGNGALLRALLEHRPTLRGIVFDLPETERDERNFGPQLEFVAGDFFEHVPSGDVYVLSGILHDWDDDRATKILRVVRESARPGARLFVIDSVIAPGNEPQGAKWLDLLMLVLSAGRERTEPEWRALLEAGGFYVDDVGDGLIQATCG